MDNVRQTKRRAKEPARNLRRAAAANVVAIIDDLLLHKIRITLSGQEKTVTALEAIIHQLVQKESAGDGRASRVLIRYEQLAKHTSKGPPQITFVDGPYTDSLAG